VLSGNNRDPDPPRAKRPGSDSVTGLVERDNPTLGHGLGCHYAAAFASAARQSASADSSTAGTSASTATIKSSAAPETP
jgi:hypothetical protein